ncbi:hypothetical protein ACFFX1_24165 [Dactylosporangium sucinum]|uniref:Uncharacterized protein n=1 Tax=Dactylosporangium sucinum TaxID=1424081 RepID=A0A917TXX8_9ACTN|nr:hypothetical protein [Dactylosporangium sucinum]GGM43944.1 hypothetical protein GCM10007977_051910 [Dactylosporangium sucinum]
MGSLALLASLVAVGYGTHYLAACAIFPFAACRRCDGTGKRRNPLSRRMFRLCPRCDGTGRRVRIGRRIYEHFRREYRNGTRGTR